MGYNFNLCINNGDVCLGIIGLLYIPWLRTEITTCIP